MKEQILPPLRTSHAWQGLQGRWCYDTWGRNGRPVVLLPAVLFGRELWWPLAAELRPHATVIAVDLPGHRDSGDRRGRYTPDDLIDDLAGLIYSLGVRRAPVVVGHASSAALATLFATRYATHAVVTVDATVPADPATSAAIDGAAYLAALPLDDIPAAFRSLAQPSDESGLLRAYQPCLDLTVTPAPGTAALAVHSSPPVSCPGAARHCWQQHIYHRPGRFAHLTDVRRLASDITTLV
ncbi:alpha/beta fold hydrolase [Actinoplanes palleronii]|uniref:AB hydrolase-1 domain-containing protein n=1 Tax=Actinoplanes palleronii TaxID=113570 RepID=A0ABQ4BPP8_9ACTN|nr:alpha/beta hydrolase [Actinoplanes palleronii]GIE72634.1 hypothetical protein Apa02nite_087420 [Actinoplanes palleronii]